MAEIAPFVLFDADQAKQFTSRRDGETKIGEAIATPDPGETLDVFLSREALQYVIIGIPEDIGVIGNHGVAGAKAGWEAFLKAFCNVQSNTFIPIEKMGILGNFELKHAYRRLEDAPPDKQIAEARQLTASIDQAVWRMVSKIIANKKTPILIGGGHNNSYGNLRGLSNGLGKPVNCINLDPHADLRPREGRHSGNGFRYALEEGFLNYYLVYGLHEGYNNSEIISLFNSKKNLHFISFEDIIVRRKLAIDQSLDASLAFVCRAPYGIEVDLDSIARMPSSAISPSGVSPELARSFVHKMAHHHNAKYLHVCEGAPSLGGRLGEKYVGKMTAYLVADFVKSHNSITS
ncbi:MAG: formimidoylglutamase [Schleiferiaceae bacterium]|nr:formimidoylglutamase [Schleiferiaceae bacterium]